MSRARKAGDWLTIAAFLAAIGAPSLGMLVGRGAGEGAGEAENRRLAEWPPIALERDALLAFPRRFNASFADRFAFREHLVRWSNRATVQWLRMTPLGGAGDRETLLASRPQAEVLVGRDGWLFFTGERVLEDYRCVRPFTRSELERWRRVLLAQQVWLAERGIRYAITIAPNKHTIYPEYLPRSINRLRSESRLDQLIAELQREPQVRIVDLRGALMAAKPRRRLYHQTDTHWNDYGAWVAYQHLMGELADWLPEAEPARLESFALEVHEGGGGDLALLLNLRETLRDEWVRLIPRDPPRSAVSYEGRSTYELKIMEQASRELPRAVVFHDSFCNPWIPHLAEHFSRVAFAWTYEFDAELIERERPQVVVQELVERMLMSPPPEIPLGLEGEVGMASGEERPRRR